MLEINNYRNDNVGQSPTIKSGGHADVNGEVMCHILLNLF